jgi:hypothetical protein
MVSGIGSLKFDKIVPAPLPTVVVNLKTASALRLQVPDSLRVAADEVIE